MAGEVQLHHNTAGQTLYFLVRSATGTIWNGTAFEAYQTADLSTQYALSMTEQGTASRYYVGDFPAAAAGVYSVSVLVKAGGSHAETDVMVGYGKIEWDGSAVVSLYSRLAPTTAGRTLDVSAGGEAGVDWANVGSPTTTLALTGTTIATTQKVDIETIKTQAVTCAAGVTVLASVGTAATSTAQTGDSYAIVNSGTHGNAAIKGYVDDIGVAGAGLTAIPWNAAWDAEVQSEVQDAIEVNHLDHFIAVADPGGVVANSSFLAKLVSKSATPAFSSFDSTTDSLEALRDRGDTAWITATGFSTLDAAGVRTAVGLASANLDTQLTAIAGYIDTEVGAIYSRLGAPAGASLAADIAAMKVDTAAILDDTGTSGVAVASGSKAGYALASTGADLVLVDGKTLPAALQIIAAICGGKVTGAGSGVEIFKGLDGSTTRATVTVDSDGNRSGVTYG